MKFIGSLGQWAALFFCILGLYIEISYGADLGYLCITFGAIMLTIFTKLKHEKED